MISYPPSLPKFTNTASLIKVTSLLLRYHLKAPVLFQVTTSYIPRECLWPLFFSLSRSSYTLPPYSTLFRFFPRVMMNVLP